ncbi:uncharacterized protein [Rutidosis leptorrhynchoides]|uniref:uncharacterized protein n=1 Tax=Rutidosis leptorrhynchoides TaxID=125765 RepID=UPI003A9A6616
MDIVVWFLPVLDALNTLVLMECRLWLSLGVWGLRLKTNLDRFMMHTTPSVTAQHFTKSFVLSDLWELFNEWSAFGVGVPLILNEQNSVVQYYAPSLSAIQLYVDPIAPTTSLSKFLEFVYIRPGDDSDESSRATSSEDSYNAGAAVVRGPRSRKHNDYIALSFNKHVLRDEVLINDSDDAEVRNPPGPLTFEYFERVSPFQCKPLTNKISDLEYTFPELKTYRSCDLTRSSWLSVAWYPIYRTPVGSSLQNVDTSFLTFHSLSTPLKYGNWLHPSGSMAREVHEARIACQLSLPIFGLAVYKFKNSDWTQNGIHGTQKINSLINSADNWLRNLDFHHPDYMFFKYH